jgi:hypothetical protein
MASMPLQQFSPFGCTKFGKVMHLPIALGAVPHAVVTCHLLPVCGAGFFYPDIV